LFQPTKDFVPFPSEDVEQSIVLALQRIIYVARLIRRVGERFQVDLTVRVLFEFPTIGEAACRLAASEAAESYSHLVKLQAGRGEKTVFCFPYSGGFHTEYAHFTKLARLIGPDYCFYGLRARGTDGVSKPHRSVEEMVAAYIKEIRIVQSNGPYFLLGECGGAPEAYETAQQLRAGGEKVALLAFLDGRGGSHFLDRYLGRRISARVRYHIARLSGSETWNYLRTSSLFHLSELKRLDGGKRLRYFLEKTCKAVMLTLNIGRRNVSSHQPPGSAYEHQAKPKTSRRVQRIIRSYGLAVRRYRHRPYLAKITIIANEEWYGRDPTLGWADLALGGLEIHKIPGNHDTYLRDHLQTAADKLRACLQKAEIQASS
jgi:thioesterase domain-containing protein